MLRQVVVALLKQGQLSSGTVRKLDKAGAAKQKEFAGRVIHVPGGGRRTKSGLYLP